MPRLEVKMLTLLQRYWRIWLITALNEVQVSFINRWANVLFLTGKAIRYAVMLIFLFLLRNNVREVGGYNADQMLVFYITYQLVDVGLQVVYRGVYEFGMHVRNGTFDGILLKPVNPLFKVLTGTPDLNDVLFLIPSTLISAYLLATSGLSITLVSSVLFLSLLFNSFLIGTGIHIFVLSLTLLLNDVDNIMWLYRDVAKLGQFPVTVYFEFIRLALFFIVPIGLMVTIPSQVLLNLSPTFSITLSFALGIGFFLLSLRFWQWSVKKYSGASS